MTNPTESSVIAELARESERFAQVIDPNADYDIFVNVLRDGESLTVDSHEQYRSGPRRDRGTTTVTDVVSFAELLHMDMHAGSVIFADETASRLTAVVNYDGWRDHRVILQLDRSEQYKRWTGKNNQMMAQSAFAELIEDSLADIQEPDAADMLELAQEFQATKEVQFESGRRINSGASKLRYSETIDARAGKSGDIEIPTQLVIGIPLWRGAAAVALRANFRYSIGNGRLSLGYRFVDLDDINQDAFLDLIQDLRNLLAPPPSDTDQATSGDTVPAAPIIVSGPAPDRIFALS